MDLHKGVALLRGGVLPWNAGQHGARHGLRALAILLCRQPERGDIDDAYAYQHIIEQLCVRGWHAMSRMFAMVFIFCMHELKHNLARVDVCNNFYSFHSNPCFWVIISKRIVNRFTAPVTHNIFVINNNTTTYAFT